MPVYSFKCQSCKREFKRIVKQLGDGNIACTCGSTAQRFVASVPGISVMEHLDNGIMARAIDRPADAAKLFRERSEAYKREFMKDIDDDDLEPIDETGDQVDPS